MLFTDVPVSIFDYGYSGRDDWRGQSCRCGTLPLKPFLRIPECPFLWHSATKLLWAIELATAILQDRPTRKQTKAICEKTYNIVIDRFGEKPGKADVMTYWKDLFRLGFINQFRRRYGPGSNKHFDVVYELSEIGKHYLEVARANQLVIEKSSDSRLLTKVNL